MMELNTMKVTELKKIAKEMNIGGWWEMKKKQLIEAIEAVESNRQTEEPVVEVEEVIAEEPQIITEELAVEVDMDDHAEEEIVSEVNEDVRKDEPVEDGKRKNQKRLLEYDGRTQTLNAWARELGVRHQTLYYRIVMNGMDVAEAFEKSIKKATTKAGK